MAAERAEPRVVFVDTAYLVALMDSRDGLHARAVSLAEELADDDAALVTSDAMLLELGAYFARGPLRTDAIGCIDAIRASGGWEVVGLDRSLLARAEARYRAHADKTWSLADCVAMEVLSLRNIREIASCDRGFAQAGFRILLRWRLSRAAGTPAAGWVAAVPAAAPRGGRRRRARGS